MIDPNALVAISVSASAPRDLHDRGLSDLHLRFVFTELVRHVLAAGGCIAYGGRLDLPADEQPNFTRVMLDMVSGYRPDLRPDDHRLVNFAAATAWAPDDPSRRAEFEQLVRLYQGRFQVDQCPEWPQQLPAGAGPQSRDVLALTSMRERMADQCVARVVLGGRLDQYAGRYPGVVEEAILTSAAQRALYVVGGFGGAGAALAARLMGRQVPELTQQWHNDRSPATHEVATLLAQTPYRLDLDADLAAALPPGDWAALRNGLGETDNLRLAETTDTDEVVALVMRGLHAIAPAKP
jgi:hypothetical protein